MSIQKITVYIDRKDVEENGKIIIREPDSLLDLLLSEEISRDDINDYFISSTEEISKDEFKREQEK